MPHKTRRRSFKKGGGGSLLTPSAFPQGVAWGTTALPGQGGNASDIGNYFRFNTNEGKFPDTIDTNNQRSFLAGGKRKKIYTNKVRTKLSRRKRTRRMRKIVRYKQDLKRIRTMKGGSDRNILLQLPEDIGRGTIYGIGSLVNQWSGKTNSLSPSPTDQMPYSGGNSLTATEIIDPISIRKAAGDYVASI